MITKHIDLLYNFLKLTIATQYETICNVPPDMGQCVTISSSRQSPYRSMISPACAIRFLFDVWPSTTVKCSSSSWCFCCLDFGWDTRPVTATTSALVCPELTNLYASSPNSFAMNFLKAAEYQRFYNKGEERRKGLWVNKKVHIMCTKSTQTQAYLNMVLRSTSSEDLRAYDCPSFANIMMTFP